MTDRLSQLQLCVNQLVEQFNATVNYVNTHSEMGLLDDNPMSVSNIAATAPVQKQGQLGQEGQQSPPRPNEESEQQTSQGQQSHQNIGVDSNRQSNGANTTAGSEPATARADAEHNFENTINELATDIILKSRQITMLIDSLPGIGVSSDSQLELIEKLTKDLKEVEEQRIRKIKEKDQIVDWCESLITELARGISETRA